MEAFVILLAVVIAGHHAWKHGAEDRRRSRDKHIREMARRYPKGMTTAQKRKAAGLHDGGWWTREILGGFPVHRTGWHAGWLSHQTAVLQQQEIRAQARDVHQSYRQTVTDRLGRARANGAVIDAAIGATPEPPRSRRAVRRAVEQDPAGATLLYPAFPRHGEDPPEGAVPPVPAAPGSGPYARRADARPGDSTWLQPGEKRCTECGGSGAAPDSPAACPACRGWGSAPPDPGAPGARPGTICTACGRPGTPDDPVLTDGPHFTHRSHAIRAARNVPDAPGSGPGPWINGIPVTTVSAAQPDASREPPARQENGTTTTGETMTTTASEMTYGQSLQMADEIVAECDEEIARLRTRQVMNKVEMLAAAGVDPASLSHLADAGDAVEAQIKAAQQQMDGAQAFRDNLVRVHGQGAEYHQGTPGGGAEKSFLQE